MGSYKNIGWFWNFTLKAMEPSPYLGNGHGKLPLMMVCMAMGVESMEDMKSMALGPIRGSKHMVDMHSTRHRPWGPNMVRKGASAHPLEPKVNMEGPPLESHVNLAPLSLHVDKSLPLSLLKSKGPGPSL